MINIGKSGWEAIVDEAKLRLKKQKVLKFKVNQALIEGRMKEFTKKIAEKLAEKTNSTIEDIRGRTFTLRHKGD